MCLNSLYKQLRKKKERLNTQETWQILKASECSKEELLERTWVHLKMKMVNLTVNEETAIQDLSCKTRGLLYENQRIIISAFHIPISITAFLGNALIIIALQKPSSLHLSSKLLFGCLAVTDLGVGLIAQPLRVTYLMYPENSKFCNYTLVLYNTLGVTSCKYYG